ncbi:MAG TPA: fumarylacetoacetate hydrolase family protein [Rhizobacter sp.]|nr:fumarylacetoacetate hydrolase family protein [Rhizobacter sp.]
MPATLDDVIEALVRAYREPEASDALPLAGALRDLDDAYLVQTCVGNELGWWDDAPALHWKSGAASRTATQTHSPLPPRGVLRSPADMRARPALRMRLIEAEIAFRLGEPINNARAAALNHDNVMSVVDAMAVSIEVVDSRWQQGPQAEPLLRVADLQSHGALVLGEWLPCAARDWAAQVCRVKIGQQPELLWQGSHACGDPTFLLPEWLRHVTREGFQVPAGSVVSTGTWCGAPAAQRGDLVQVSFDGLGQARVQL